MSAPKLQEETFETPDVPDEELKTEEPVVEKNKDTIEEVIQPTLAFQRFAGRVFDPSQPVTKNWQAEVYDSSSKLEAKFESPLQKYRRLKYEISNFEKQLSNLSRKVAQGEDPSNEITHQLNQELTKMWSNVEQFKSRPELATLFAESNSSMLETIDSNYLFKRLQEFQLQSKDTNNKNANDINRAIFTLYHDGALNNKTYRLNDLNDRINNLEKIIGPVNSDISSIGDMIGSIEYLNKRLDLLSDELKLDALARRANSLRKELNDISLKKDTQEMENQIAKVKEGKIESMFEMMKRWDQAAHQLPLIIGRLQSLKVLNEESTDVTEKIKYLEAQQTSIGKTLDENKNILNKLNDNLSNNAKQMLDNVNVIEQKLSQLQQQMKKSGL